ncbi:hypothetical protein ACVD2R_11740 [Escherichia coli]|uniref:hypothetical protein n=1 Tax=Escherichia coli TaxID=562 RepID=UPI001400416B|nr:hypothetical protein [Escherichia coli]MWT73217.1 hypothetical protein [Escherichia coli]
MGKEINLDKYRTLEQSIIEILTPVPTTFATLFSGEIKAECHRIAARESNPQPARILDRHLLALIKDGRIYYTTGKGWFKCGGTV